MATGSEQEPARVNLTVAPPWRVTYSELYAVEPADLAPNSYLWSYLVEDLIQIEGPRGLLIDMGWYPDGDPRGRFVAVVIRDTEWRKPLDTREASSLANAKQAIVSLCVAWGQSEPTPESRAPQVTAPEQRRRTTLRDLIDLYSNRNRVTAQVKATKRPCGLWTNPLAAHAFLEPALAADTTSAIIRIPDGIAVVVRVDGERPATHARIVRDAFGTVAAVYPEA